MKKRDRPARERDCPLFMGDITFPGYFLLGINDEGVAF